MDKLVLNIEDIDDKEAFLKKLQQMLGASGVTANGIFRIEVDPENDKDKGAVKIINNAPVLSGMEVIYGDDNMVYFWKESGPNRYITPI